MSKLFVEALLKNILEEYGKKPIRQATAKMMADTGSDWTVITEDVQKILQLPEPRTMAVTVVGGRKVLCRIVEGLSISFGDNYAQTQALVVPGQTSCILGVTTLEMMGLAVDPKGQKLYPVYGEGIVGGIGC
jgi:predicted aspartyl protease